MNRLQDQTRQNPDGTSHRDDGFVLISVIWIAGLLAVVATAFAITSNGERETGGLYLVRYSVDAEGTLLAERRILRDRQSTETNKVVLLRDVAGVSFKYLDSTDYFDIWQRKDSLPSAIEMNMTFSSANPRKWQPALIRLQTAE